MGQNNSYVVVELETSGKNKHIDCIVAIDAVKIENGVIGDRFFSYAQSMPGSRAPLGQMGISADELKSAPTIVEVLKRFEAFIRGCALVVNDFLFDFEFLHNQGFWCGVDFYPYAKDAVDLSALSKSVLEGLDDYSVKALAERLGIMFAPRHTVDALAAAKVFLRVAAAARLI